MEKTPDKNSPETGFTDEFLSHAFTPQNVGVLTDPDGYGAPKGACGDTVEIYLQIRNGTIDQALFLTDGCAHTIACANVVTTLARGRTVEEARAIDPEDVSEVLGGLPENHVHCARLAVTTLRLALKNYLKNLDQAWKRPYRKSPWDH
jgi:NifU-like protein involved in Fe-S cluster formation